MEKSMATEKSKTQPSTPDKSSKNTFFVPGPPKSKSMPMQTTGLRIPQAESSDSSGEEAGSPQATFAGSVASYNRSHSPLSTSLGKSPKFK